MKAGEVPPHPRQGMSGGQRAGDALIQNSNWGATGHLVAVKMGSQIEACDYALCMSWYNPNGKASSEDVGIY